MTKLHLPETAPKTGTVILGDFGDPWLSPAAWNEYDDEWAITSVQACPMAPDGKHDTYWETTWEKHASLVGWMPMLGKPAVNETDEKERAHLLKIAHERKEFFLDVDGYTYYWPEKNIGHLSSHQLRWIADELDRINAPWEKMTTLEKKVAQNHPIGSIRACPQPLR